MAWLDFVSLVNDKKHSLLVVRHHPTIETFIYGKSAIISFNNPQNKIHVRKGFAIQRFIFAIPLLTLAYTR
ncbi:hypothetical protein KPZU02_22000 [Klebsiella pneumoniae]|nr:hypothetical protein KPZU02_22000 [Klebsiella pneumoniae]